MRRALLVTLALLALSSPAKANILVLVDSLGSDPVGDASMKNAGPLLNLLGASVRPGVRLDFQDFDKNVFQNLPPYSLAELRDSVYPTATNNKYKYSLIVVINGQSFGGTNDPNSLPPMQLTKAANRPRVPVMYVSFGTTAVTFQNSAACSLGVIGGPEFGTASAFVTSPAGYAFPGGCNGCMWKRAVGGTYPAMGDYVTPVLWLKFYNFSRSDFDGVGGTSPSAADTMMAWFYNPPNVTTYTDRMTAGFGCINLEPASIMSGATNFPSSLSATVAVGMMARLAPDQFKFPARKIALDIDDGSKRFSGVASAAQVEDFLSGIDSLTVNKIPFTVGEETDSLGARDANGESRWYNEGRRILKGYGKVTVHNHFGMTGGNGGNAADTVSSSIANRVYANVWSANLTNRVCFGGDQSVWGLARGSRLRLIEYAGKENVSRHVMPPGDDYSTNRIPFGGESADSMTMAIGMAGYRVVRSQYNQVNNSVQTANIPVNGIVGYFNSGGVVPIPNAAAVAATLTIGQDYYSKVLYAPSQYLYGATTDTARTDAYGPMFANVSMNLARALGRTAAFDLAGVDSSTQAVRYGAFPALIVVTHCPNWRSGGVTGEYMKGSRPGWESCRNIHGAMEAAKWAAMQSNTATVTYFRDGPVRWVFCDQLSEYDLR